jgi:hypothetical protein
MMIEIVIVMVSVCRGGCLGESLGGGGVKQTVLRVEEDESELHTYNHRTLFEERGGSGNPVEVVNLFKLYRTHVWNCHNELPMS